MSEILSIQARWMINEQYQTIKDQHIIVENGKFSYIGKYSSENIPRDAEKIEYKKGLLIPPFINAHTHLPETLIRGLIDDASLQEWLFEHVWKVEPNMNSSDATIGAKLGALEMLSSGTIGFNDQYFYANEIAEVVELTGMKALLAPSIFENNPETGSIENGFKKNMEVLKKWHKKDNRIFIGFGPHAQYTVEEEMFKRIYEEAEKHDTFIHTHVNESRREVLEAEEKFGKNAVKLFNDWGILDRVFAAHCVHLDQIDRKLLKTNNVPILHNIQSNLKIGSGIAPIDEYINFGLNVVLGTDGSASNNNLDMLEEVRLTSLLHKGIREDPLLIDARTALKMGTSNASVLFPKGVYSGIIKEGEPADFVIVNQSSINMTPVINPLSNWIFSGNPSNVSLTASNGKILYRDNNFLTLNADKILEDAQLSSERMMSDSEYEAIEFRE